MYLIIILHYHVLSQRNISLALELQSILENLGTKILNNLTIMKEVLDECLTLNFIIMTS